MSTEPMVTKSGGSDGFFGSIAPVFEGFAEGVGTTFEYILPRWMAGELLNQTQNPYMVQPTYSGPGIPPGGWPTGTAPKPAFFDFSITQGGVFLAAAGLVAVGLVFIARKG